MAKLPPIAVRRYGTQGLEVVLLHGGPGAPGSVSGLAKLLAAEHRILEPLQRRSGVTPLTVARHVADLAEVLPPRCAIVGHSWGAMLGLSYAAQYPERVSRLVLVGCGTYSEDCRAELNKTLEARLGETGIQKVNDLRQQLDNSTDQEEKERLYRQLGAVFSVLESYELVDQIEAERDELPTDERGSEETWADVQSLQQRGIEPQRFSAIGSPVIMIQGEDDPHPSASTAELLKQYIPQLEHLPLDRCGHEPWRELYARDLFLQALQVWLRR